MILSGDMKFQSALDKYENGDDSELRSLINAGALNNSQHNLQLLDDMGLGFLNLSGILPALVPS